jgi:hypothetical protein
VQILEHVPLILNSHVCQHFHAAILHAMATLTTVGSA